MRKNYIVVLLFALIMILLIFRSSVFEQLGASGSVQKMNRNQEKFEKVLDYISSYYVDEVDWDSSVQSAIQRLLLDLDPHSVYISAEDAQLNEENFQGEYQGIGISYDIIDRNLTVISAIPGSPSDKLGLLPGDRIIEINGNSAIGISRSEVPKKLKGPKGTHVTIKVRRDGIDDPLEFTITRDRIPIYTVETYFMQPDSTGYIFVTRFAKTTEEEFDKALTELESQGMRRLILDLRWNAGGYLDQAVKIAARFIHGRKKIVYTTGRLPDFNEEFYSDTYGIRKVRNMPLIVLINGASASASEIVAGAIQDYDRGIIVGQTSFGKGLVQREFPLPDSSQLRLTISKYYTPSGRLIQRPYKGKDISDYYLQAEDSTALQIPSDSVAKESEYYTALGRKVYGGGGINPDTLVEADSSYRSKLIQNLSEKRVFFEIAARYANHNQHWKSSFDSFLKDFEVKSSIVEDLKESASGKGIEFTAKEFALYSNYIRLRLKAEISRSFWGIDKYRRVMLKNDRQFQAALEIFPHTKSILNRALLQSRNN